MRPYCAGRTNVKSFPRKLRKLKDRMDNEIAVVGAGVVGAATALELSRRGASVAVLEAEPEPALQASGTNSGILHTGFDSEPGELETELILRAAQLRDPVIEALQLPVIRCGALMAPLASGDAEAIAALAGNAERNGVEVTPRPDGALEIPGEAVTDPVAFTLGLVAAARRHGAELRTGFRVAAIERGAARNGEIRLSEPGGGSVEVRVVVNCAGLGAGEVARLAGDSSFDVYPRKGEFLVFEPPEGASLGRILLPVPGAGTKGVLVFPTVDGKVVAGPTAIDQQDPDDWAVRCEARDEIMPKAEAIYPPLQRVEPIASYAGLRPAGRGVNYVIARSTSCPQLVNAAAIRSTGLTASLAIAERIAALVAEAGVALDDPAPLVAGTVAPVSGPWWRRTAELRAG
jgi:glycerol-3-phosphate dehydrogenase